MTPAARVQAAIELLDEIIAAANTKGPPADRLIGDYFRARRYAGSKDRRGVRDLVYRAVRACGPVPVSGRAAILALAKSEPYLIDLFDGSPYGPVQIVQGEPVAHTGLASQWLAEHLAASGIKGDAAEALLERAPLDIRVNTLKADRASLDLPLAGEHLLAQQGLRLPLGTPVEQWDEYGSGYFEVQDHGSQLAIEAIAAKPGDTVLDLCAGAGGKTLALAAKLGNTGTLLAADTNRRRLDQLAPRADRAGALIDQTILLDPGREREGLSLWERKVDHVLVDAPCSGSGTWRRNPESRWRLDEAELDRLIALQDHVLDVGACCVRPGGTLTYVTCSLLDVEGPARINAFLRQHSDWQAEPSDLTFRDARGVGTRLDPFHHGTDGFFIAILRAPC